MPREQVDGASLAEQGERDLGTDVPASRSERGCDLLDEGGVSLVEEAIQEAAAPLKVNHQSAIEGSDDSPKGCQADQLDPTALDPRDDRLGNPCSLGEVQLAPPEAAPEGSNCQAEASIVHRRNHADRRLSAS